MYTKKETNPMGVVLVYRIWLSMIRRCEDPKCKQYYNYGGRGIKVCDEWKDFNNFFTDVGHKPFSNAHLDRKDNDSGYNKENCRWTTPTINHRNKRNNKYYETHLGRICQSELIEKMGYTRSQFRRAKEKYGTDFLIKMFSQNLHPDKRNLVDLNDIIGKTINNFTVNSLDEDKSTGARYFCTCCCGYNVRRSRWKLLNIKSTHCISCGKKGILNPKNKPMPKKQS